MSADKFVFSSSAPMRLRAALAAALLAIGYVPGGIIEILDRQSEGWRYLEAD